MTLSTVFSAAADIVVVVAAAVVFVVATVFVAAAAIVAASVCVIADLVYVSSLELVLCCKMICDGLCLYFCPGKKGVLLADHDGSICWQLWYCLSLLSVAFSAVVLAFYKKPLHV